MMTEPVTLIALLDEVALVINDPTNRGRNGALKANPLLRVQKLVAMAQQIATDDVAKTSCDGGVALAHGCS